MKKEIDYEVDQPTPEKEVGTVGSNNKVVAEEKESSVNIKIIALIVLVILCIIAIFVF